jgi:NAD+ diphosphatase
MRAPEGDPGDAYWFCVRAGQVLVLVDDDGPGIPIGGRSPVEDGGVHVLGSLDDQLVFGVDTPDDAEFPPGFEWRPLRGLFGQVPEVLWTLAGRADQIVAWDRTHRFCGRCSTATTAAPGERARKCPKCGLLVYPRLSPATITLVTRGENDEEALLAHGRQFPGRFYSTLAGFVEPGESLEQCVAREIKEEVGVDISDIRYFGSQPWPFPNSLMVGFRARYAGGELVLQEEEIVDAGWYTADDLPPCPRGGMSIAGWLIESWLAEQAGRRA